ncbi:MAG: HAD family phosphatase [Oscillospiraceae bacterium]|nr:HAD family phosphatase [Oscillospiraceae bacterium]MBR3077963.1 HAD family phosphatase [Oscillospiraceae bacterium]
MELRCVLFDFDGVVADTEPSNTRYLEQALAVFGLKLNDEQRLALIGVNGLDFIRPLLASAEPPVSDEAYLAVRQKQGNTYENSPDLKAQPGLRDFLGLLRGAGIKTGLVSSTSSRLILAALNRLALADQFDAILCGDMVRRKKPDPEGYRRAMELLQVPPECCVVVEDSPVGIRAGLSAGAWVVGYEGASVPQDTGLAQDRLKSFFDCPNLPVFRDALAKTDPTHQKTSEEKEP